MFFYCFIPSFTVITSINANAAKEQRLLMLSWLTWHDQYAESQAIRQKAICLISNLNQVSITNVANIKQAIHQFDDMRCWQWSWILGCWNYHTTLIHCTFDPMLDIQLTCCYVTCLHATNPYNSWYIAMYGTAPAFIM